jgi:hypothetical protein
MENQIECAINVRIIIKQLDGTLKVGHKYTLQDDHHQVKQMTGTLTMQCDWASTDGEMIQELNLVPIHICMWLLTFSMLSCLRLAYLDMIM